MEHLFDEFSKSLNAAVPRRESLRRLGAVFAGAVLTPFGVSTAWAAKPDPCKTFCKCRNSSQQSACLSACKKCNGDTARLAGSCGSYTCCSKASCKGKCSDLKSDPNCGACGNNCKARKETCCGNYCADLKNDIFNCGRCGTICAPPLPGEVVDCISGACIYDCAEGATDCDGACTYLWSDPDNCGACGNVCGGDTPYCVDGTCEGGGSNGCYWGQVNCGGVCTYISSDLANCGGCGVQCAGGESCIGGSCQPAEPYGGNEGPY